MKRFQFLRARIVAPMAAFGAILASATLCTTPLGATTLDFEDLTLSQIYDLNAGTPANPDSFVTNGVPVQLAEFFLLPSGSTTSGSAIVNDSAANPSLTAGGSGNFLFTSNVNLEFGLGAPVSQLSFLFGEFGGNLNLRVNGVLENVQSFFLLPATIGGAGVAVESLGSTISGELGRVTLTGNVASFSAGGQEFSIDDVQFTLVPEPATWVLALAGLGALFVVRRRYVRRLARCDVPSNA